MKFSWIDCIMVKGKSVRAKKTSKSKFTKHFFKGLNKYYRIFFVLIIMGVMLGSVHGFYMNYVNHKKHQFYSGIELCNGEVLSGEIITQTTDKSLLINYFVKLKRGRSEFSLFDPSGEQVFYHNDWEDYTRLKKIDLKKHKAGKWTFSLSCDKADLGYEISFDVN